MVSVVSYRMLPGYDLKWDGICVPNGMEDTDNGDLYLYVHNIDLFYLITFSMK